ncbi:MAG: hypothetical protein JWM35_917 [Verrucomicrobia bacterium]|nr:hypothetical protein [Verrucomicrobiota bacterium]
MSAVSTRHIDRFTLTSDLAMGARKMVRFAVIPVLLLSVLAAAYLLITGRPGAMAVVLMGVGASFVLFAWKNLGVSVPLTPLIAVQHLVIYGLPIVIGNETVIPYSDRLLRQSGLELLVFFVALAGGWRAGMQFIPPSEPISRALRIITMEGNRGLQRVGYSLILFTTLYYLLQSLDLFSSVVAMLPSGSESMINTLTSVAALCGFFIIALEVGSGKTSITNVIAFWFLFTVNCLLTAVGLLLSSTTGFIAAVAIGLFWGSQRVPWVFLVTVLSLLAFFSLGKYEMRTRYWENSEDFIPFVALQDLPSRYAEWAQVSVETLTRHGTTSMQQQEAAETGSVLSRINNLQNLLYVMDETETHETPLLHGATYSLIPPLLIPRIFWPDKPRTHEGQVMLNVHFGRQDLISSFRSYIAWGLLPEAYGNFGPWMGSVFLGLVLGWLGAWYERYFSNKLVISLEGFIAFTIFLGVAASFEMVASVLVTSMFQGVMVVVIACLPFVHKTRTRRPEPRPREPKPAQ